MNAFAYTFSHLLNLINQHTSQ